MVFRKPALQSLNFIGCFGNLSTCYQHTHSSVGSRSLIQSLQYRQNKEYKDVLHTNTSLLCVFVHHSAIATPPVSYSRTLLLFFSKYTHSTYTYASSPSRTIRIAISLVRRNGRVKGALYRYSSQSSASTFTLAFSSRLAANFATRFAASVIVASPEYCRTT